MEEEEVMYLEDDQIARLKQEGSQILSDSGFKAGSQTFSAKDSVLGVFELDFKPFLIHLQQDLTGLRYNEKTRKIEKVHEELMPIQCTRQLMNLLRAILFLNTPMTNLDEDRVKMSITAIQKSLDRMLFNFAYFDKVDVTTIWYLSRTCGQQIENALFRAKDGIERQLRATNINVQSQQRPMEEQEKKKKSIFPTFWRGKSA